MKTSLDVIEQAYRRLGIKAEGESLSADQHAYADSTLRALVEEMAQFGPVTWFPDLIPPPIFVPLANLLAAEIGPAYSVPSEPRGGPYLRLMAAMRADDREPDTISAGAVYF